MTPRRLLVLGALVTLAVYVRALGFGLAYEDVNVFPLPPWSWAWFVSPRGAYALSFWLTGSPVLAHAANLGLHLVNGWIVWRIATVWLPASAAVWAAVLTWLAPIQVESVAYLQGRGDLLIGTCALVAVAALVRRPMTIGRWTVVAAACGVAIWTKELGLMVAPIALWTAFSWRMTARMGSVLWGVLGAAALGAAVLLAQTEQFHLRALISDQSIVNYASMQACAVWRYVALLVWPVGLSIDHDFELVTVGWRIVALVSLGGVGVLVWRGRHHLAGWAVGAALLSIAPRFVLRQEEFMHEHHMYVAVCFLSFAVAAGVAAFTGKEVA